jgi:hypothetical protein
MPTKTPTRYDHIDEISEFAEAQKQLAELHATKRRAVETLTSLAPQLQMSAADAVASAEAARMLGAAISHNPHEISKPRQGAGIKQHSFCKFE